MLKKIALVAGVALAAFCGLVTGVGALQRPVTLFPPELRGTHVNVDGTRIRVAQSGLGPDVVLLHGSPGSLEDWDPVFATLAQHFRVTAFDRIGNGYSEGADLPHTPEENARMTTGLLAALRLKKVLLVGHSYGGITALHLATRYPENVGGFVLIGTRGYRPVNVDPVFRILALPAFGPGFATLVAPVIGPGMTEAAVKKSFGPNPVPEGFVAARAPMYMRPTVSYTLAAERVTLAAALDEMQPHYASIRKPVTIVCGDQDEPNTSQAPRLAKEIPGSRYVPLANTGHMVQFARPAELVKIIEEAAEELRR